MADVTVTGDRARAYQAYRAVIDALVELADETSVHPCSQSASEGIDLSGLGAGSAQLFEPTSDYLVELAVIAETVGAQLRELAAAISD